MPALISIFGNGGELRQLENAVVLGDLIAANDKSAEFGLTLSERDARELVEVRSRSLRDTERVELGSGAILKLIEKFCASSYLNTQNYAETLGELLEIFYYYKTESRDKISDVSLIDAMYSYFEGPCHGSTELLATRDLDTLLRYIKEGRESTELDRYDNYDSYPEFEGDL
jgi:hypothetical protein